MPTHVHLYQVASWCIQPFGHNRNGPKIGEGAPPPFGGRRLGPHLTQSRLGWGLTPYQVAFLIHAAIWRQQIWAENWVGLCPFGGGAAGSLSNTMWPGPRLTCMPSFILIRPTVARTLQTDRTDRQRTDSIGRTILQTVSQEIANDFADIANSYLPPIYGRPITGRPYIFSRCGLFFFLFFPRLISATADWMSAILPHMVWP